MSKKDGSLNDTDFLDYWNVRGGVSYQYKGETFYTVTPIPFYYRRRALLLEFVEPLIKDDSVRDICDFGCGDGWYIKHFGDLYPYKYFYGLDISTSMIECAKKNAPFAKLQVSQKGIDFENTFDLIYAIAVFQHIKDDIIPNIFINIYDHLKSKATFVFFEATGFKRSAGNTWYRRNTQEYLGFARDAGFKIEQSRVIAFPAHRFFERRIAPYFVRFFVNGSDSHERNINANKTCFFRFLSALFMNFTRQPIRPDDGCTDGNSFYILRKL